MMASGHRAAGRRTAHAPASPSKPAGKGNGSSPATLGSESSQIVGQLGRTQQNEWLLHVGEKSYRIQLADDLTIKVALSNGHLISAGDKIVVHGEPIQGKPSACIADDVQVTLTHPLAQKQSRKRPNTCQGWTRRARNDRESHLKLHPSQKANAAIAKTLNAQAPRYRRSSRGRSGPEGRRSLSSSHSEYNMSGKNHRLRTAACQARRMVSSSGS